jgi:hypothetical protein
VNILLLIILSDPSNHFALGFRIKQWTKFCNHLILKLEAKHGHCCGNGEYEGGDEEGAG